MKQIFKKFGQDLISIAFLGLSLFLSLALFSYHPTDPSLNTFGKSLVVKNYCGFVGSFASDILYHTFGITIWILVLGMIQVSILAIRGHDSFLKNLKIVWAGILMLTLASLLTIQFPNSKLFADQVFLGGLLGVGIAKILTASMNQIGAQIFLVCIGLMAALIYLDVTLKELLLKNQVYFNKLNIFSSLAFPIPAFRNALNKTPKADTVTPYPEPDVNVILKKNDLQTGNTTKLFSTSLISHDNNETEIMAPSQNAAKNKIKIRPPQRVENWEMPKLYLLEDPPPVKIKTDKDELKKKAELLTDKLKQFSILGQIIGIKPGPAVTMFEFKPNANVKVSRITDLTEDLTLALSSESLRIIAPIPGRDVVGIESSNSHREPVFFKDLLSDNGFWNEDFTLPISLGRQANGEPRIVDLRKMPHLLIAGTTGSGKSVFTVSLITGLLFKHSPKTLRLILVDPKQVDLAVFSNLPHLIMPPVREPKKAVSALKWAIREMEKRYRSMAKFGARNLEGFNEIVEALKQNQKEDHDKINQQLENSPQTKLEQYYFVSQPYIVIVVEEFGDLMSVDKQNVEHAVVRLAQMARACGIHLILAMQSPRKEVVTGLIKANIPGRISFKVASKMDSRIILDEGGAERLLAQGDMLFLSPGVSKPQRHHGPFLKETEIITIAKHWSDQGEPIFDTGALKALEGSGGGFDFGSDVNSSSDGENQENEEYDERYDEIVAWTAELKEVSASLIQRRFRLGYPRAARLIEILEREGVVGPANGSKARQVLVNRSANT